MHTSFDCQYSELECDTPVVLRFARYIGINSIRSKNTNALFEHSEDVSICLRVVKSHRSH